ncbi:DNA-binding protein [Flavobacterium sp. XS2P14]|uniref:DNA-binding protein n=1 Tax=Flavobacterium sp. XS2P14 TaxID=3401735 RepID=UPI003AB010E3
MKDLNNSSIDRKNILNNNLAIQEVYKNIGFYGIKFEEKYRFTKQQVAQYFEVDVRTIERILEEHKEEFIQSGYDIFTGLRLKKFKETVLENVPDTNVGDITESRENTELVSKAPSLGIFTYKAFLNLGMLLSNSDKAKELRSAILDIVIDVLNKKLGGNTKYINQREEEFVPSAIREYNYRQEFTNALDAYITENKFKYAQLTDKIYKSIFKENAKEYRQILKLNTKESIRNTMYSEVLDLISSYENGFADYLKKKFSSKGLKLSLSEAHLLFKEFEELTQAVYNPLTEKARSLMASRDMVFRDALHEKLKEYVNAVSAEDFDKFLGEKSKSLEARLEENKEVFKRLKDR